MPPDNTVVRISSAGMQVIDVEGNIIATVTSFGVPNRNSDIYFMDGRVPKELFLEMMGVRDEKTPEDIYGEYIKCEGSNEDTNRDGSG